MDKSWIHLHRSTPEYEKGMENFLDHAFSCSRIGDKIKCPCRNCNNGYRKTRAEVKYHLFKWGFETTYTHWIYHGESFDSSSTDEEEELGDDILHERCTDADTYRMAYDLYRGEFPTNYTDEALGHIPEEPNDEAARFYRLLKEAEEMLYPGCEEFSKLSFVVGLLQMKCLYGWSNVSMDALLKYLKKGLPKDNKLPESMYEAQKIIRDLGLDYEKIHACVNDCILYRKEYAELDNCPICGECRWKQEIVDGEIEKGKKKKVARKILRYFPLTPRLQRLFMSPETATAMRWHEIDRVNDGVLRHPADSVAWKSFDEKYHMFSQDPRNVRLGLATDGFNPFGNMSTSYSTWPIVLIVYNLPPWLCMKQSYFMISSIIPGPKSPGIDVDVYMCPLIDELKDLWESGALTYDSSLKSNFQMHAALMWTINDFPAYGSISGWSTKGKLACPSCNKETSSLWLKYGQKHCYMNHRRFLPKEHPWRKSKTFLGGMCEDRPPPEPPSGDVVLEQYAKFEQVTFGKTSKKRKRDDNLDGNWRKKSILFELPYWKSQLVRHNLDVMHIEKNISESVFGTLMSFEGKSKDTLKSRLDLQNLNMLKELHPIQLGSKVIIPPARYTLSKDEKKVLCNFLKEVKFPDGYASNISRCINVNEGKCSGLKSHDCHVLFQRLLPLAIRGILPKEVCTPLIELSIFFSELCSKVVEVHDLDRIHKHVVETLCKLEKIFPPAFFDVMVHLSVHLANEAKLAGPVQFRWMYPIERYLRTLKGYVRNKAHPEGSIAEGYLAEECMTFCSRYLKHVGSKLDRPDRVFDGGEGEPQSTLSVFSHPGMHMGADKYELISLDERDKAHSYVLQNCTEVLPWISEHMDELKKESCANVEQRHNALFAHWFKERVSKLYKQRDPRITDDLYTLAQGPDRRAYCYGGYCTNGFRFRTKDNERLLKTQNSGVLVRGDDCTGNVDYYGVITHIMKLEYIRGKSVVLFKCNWFDVPSHGQNQTRGCKKDEFGFVSLDVTRLRYVNEPFVLASQAQQVYYVDDAKNKNWRVVVKTQPRNAYDIPTKNVNDDQEITMEGEPYQLNELRVTIPTLYESISMENFVVDLTRYDMEAHNVDANTISDLAIEEEENVNNDNEEEEELQTEDEEELEDDDWI